MLDDHAGRPFIKLLDAFQRSIGIRDIVVRQCLALQLPGGGDAGFRAAALNIECSALVGIFTIAHALHLAVLQTEGLRKGLPFTARVKTAQVIGNGAVIAGGMFKCLGRQPEACGSADFALVCGHFLQHLRVVCAVNQHRHGGMIFGCRPDQCRSTDVDILDSRRQITIRTGDGLFKGIEIDHHHIDGCDIMFLHNRIVAAATSQDATMNFRVQGLDPAGHHFRETGVIRDFDDFDAVV